MIRFTCPNCKMVLQAADNQAGAMASCPKCKTQMKVPAPVPPQTSPMPSMSKPPVPPSPLPSAPILKAAPPSPQPQATEAGSSGPPPLPATAPPQTPWWKRALAEVQETGAATWGQAVKLVNYGRGLWRKRSLNRTTLDAQRALGHRMYEAGAGDPQLRSQLAAVDEKVRQAEAKKESTKALKAEKERLLLQLAGPALTQPGPVPGTEAEYTKAKESQTALHQQTENMSRARTALPPKDRTAWRRVMIGFGTVGGVGLLGFCLLCSGMGSFFGFRGKSGGPGGSTDNAGRPVLPDFSKVDYTVPKVDYSVPDFSKLDYSKAPAGEPIVKKEGFDNEKVMPFTEQGYADKGTFKRHGPTVFWQGTPQGGKKGVEQFWFNGELHGTHTGWHQNGVKGLECTWVNGQQQGKAVKWHPNGKMQEEAYWFKNKLHGDYKKWIESGQAEVDGAYKDGKHHGKWLSWHPNGKPAAEEYFLDGKNHGPSKSWFPNGNPKLETVFVTGLQHGKRTDWHENGQKWMEAVYLNDKKQGPAKQWYENGKLAREEEYLNGKRHGKLKDWNDEGKLNIQVQFTDGMPAFDSKKAKRDEFFVMLDIMADKPIHHYDRRDRNGNIVPSNSDERESFVEDHFFRIFGRPESGYNRAASAWQNHRKENWRYRCVDGNLLLKIEVGTWALRITQVEDQ